MLEVNLRYILPNCGIFNQILQIMSRCFDIIKIIIFIRSTIIHMSTMLLMESVYYRKMTKTGLNTYKYSTKSNIFQRAYSQFQI